MNDLKNKKTPSDSPKKILYYVLLNLLAKLEARQVKARFKHMSPKQVQIAVNGCEKRTENLAQEIIRQEQLIGKKRRIFVIAGAWRLMQFPAPHRAGNVNVIRNIFNDRRYVIITSQAIVKENNLESLNPDLAKRINLLG